MLSNIEQREQLIWVCKIITADLCYRKAAPTVQSLHKQSTPPYQLALLIYSTNILHRLSFVKKKDTKHFFTLVTLSCGESTNLLLGGSSLFKTIISSFHLTYECKWSAKRFCGCNYILFSLFLKVTKILPKMLIIYTLLYLKKISSY